MDMHNSEYKTGIVSISGNPNVGKSTLLNRLLGMKLAIVSPRPQTTRGVIRGIFSSEQMQILFVDNPGFLTPRDKLDEFMFKQARDSLHSAELIYLVVEPKRPDDLFETEILQPVIETKKPVFLIINKIDTVAKPEILPLIEAYRACYDFEQIIPISAANGENIDTLLAQTAQYLPEGPPLFPEEMVSDQYERFFVSELIREKIFLLTHHEVPYSVAIRVDEFKQREQGKWFIRATIVVERDSHKGIIIGKNGSLIKRIGQSARRDIEDMIDTACFLELHVKVIKNWKKSEMHLRDFGYKF